MIDSQDPRLFCKDATFKVDQNASVFVIDVGVRGRKFDEDKLLLSDPKLRNFVRRGLAFLNDFNSPLRVAFPKFYDYSKDDAYFKQIFAIPETVKQICLIETRKANGTNAQFSFNKSLNCWVIGSKNVTLLVKDCESDFQLGNHPNLTNCLLLEGDDVPPRFKYSIELGKMFFKQLSVLSSHQRDYLRDYLGNGFTLLGEGLGMSSVREHLIVGEESSQMIVFFGLVNHDKWWQSAGESWSALCALCAIVGLPHVFLGKTLTVSTDDHEHMEKIHSLFEDLESEISLRSLDEGGEGSVVRVEADSQLIGMFKFKTNAYKWLRRVRERSKIGGDIFELLSETGGEHMKESLVAFKQRVDSLIELQNQNKDIVVRSIVDDKFLTIWLGGEKFETLKSSLSPKQEPEQTIILSSADSSFSFDNKCVILAPCCTLPVSCLPPHTFQLTSMSQSSSATLPLVASYPSLIPPHLLAEGKIFIFAGTAEIEENFQKKSQSVPSLSSLETLRVLPSDLAPAAPSSAAVFDFFGLESFQMKQIKCIKKFTDSRSHPYTKFDLDKSNENVQIRCLSYHPSISTLLASAPRAASAPTNLVSVSSTPSLLPNYSVRIDFVQPLSVIGMGKTTAFAATLLQFVSARSSVDHVLLRGALSQEGLRSVMVFLCKPKEEELIDEQKTPFSLNNYDGIAYISSDLLKGKHGYLSALNSVLKAIESFYLSGGLAEKSPEMKLRKPNVLFLCDKNALGDTLETTLDATVKEAENFKHFFITFRLFSLPLQPFTHNRNWVLPFSVEDLIMILWRLSNRILHPTLPSFTEAIGVFKIFLKSFYARGAFANGFKPPQGYCFGDPIQNVIEKHIGLSTLNENMKMEFMRNTQEFLEVPKKGEDFIQYLNSLFQRLGFKNESNSQVFNELKTGAKNETFGDLAIIIPDKAKSLFDLMTASNENIFAQSSELVEDNALVSVQKTRQPFLLCLSLKPSSLGHQILALLSSPPASISEKSARIIDNVLRTSQLKQVNDPHITVKFLGSRSNQTEMSFVSSGLISDFKTLADAKKMTQKNIRASKLVVASHGLVLLTQLTGLEDEPLLGRCFHPPEDQIPHLTLMTSRQARPVDSNHICRSLKETEAADRARWTSNGRSFSVELASIDVDFDLGCCLYSVVY
eukprot:GDKJ01046595.1.p1 GENE.GDKJ01046595.1~~GDKJ01046595.1.p1  ORF type:complete len:1154 (-),score=258.82 GDKJ01046595.1:146-3607(-)